MTTTLSPLRYPGGKAFLANLFGAILKQNDIRDGIYIEPYAGGAGAALKLLAEGHVSEIVLNDASYSIYCFWRSVLNQTENLIELVLRTPVSVRTHKTQKQVIKDQRHRTTLEVGFAVFFLNRTNRSGIVSGGPIGGYDQSGPWKIDARFGREELVRRMRRIAQLKDRISVYNCDALRFLGKFVGRQNKNPQTHLFYFDPPYLSNGRRLYLDYYTQKDHARLARFLQADTKLRWLMTYDDVPEIRKLYRGMKIRKLDILHTANGSTVGKEIFVHSPLLDVAPIWRRRMRISNTKRIVAQMAET